MAYRSFGVILADIIQATKGTANSSGASPKYSLHLPLNRQSATYAREGIDLENFLEIGDVDDLDGLSAEPEPPKLPSKKRREKEEDESQRLKRIMAICAGC
jgi:hypothetical protein